MDRGPAASAPPKEALVGMQTKEQVHKDHRASRAWEETKGDSQGISEEPGGGRSEQDQG